MDGSPRSDLDLMDAAGFEVLVHQRPTTRPWALVLGWIAWLGLVVGAVVPVPAPLRSAQACVVVSGAEHPGHDGLLWRLSPTGRPALAPPEGPQECLVLDALPSPEELREYYAVRRSHPDKRPVDEHVEVPLPWDGAKPSAEVATVAALDGYEVQELRAGLAQWTRWPYPELTADHDRTRDELTAWMKATTPTWVNPLGLEQERQRLGLLSREEAEHRVELLQRVLDDVAAHAGQVPLRPAQIAAAVRTNRALWLLKLVLGLLLAGVTWLVGRQADAVLLRRQGPILHVGSARFLLAEGWRATPDSDGVWLAREDERVRIPLDQPGAPKPQALAQAINAGLPPEGRDAEAEQQLRTLLDRSAP